MDEVSFSSRMPTQEHYLPIDKELRSLWYDFIYLEQALSFQTPPALHTRLLYAYKILKPIQGKTYETLTLGEAHLIHEAHFVVHHGWPRNSWYLSSELYPHEDVRAKWLK